MLLDVGGGGGGSILGIQSSLFLLKKIEFPPRSDIMLRQKLIYYWQEIYFF